MTEQQFNEITAWQKKTFGQATAFSKTKHLKEEVEELLIEVAVDGAADGNHAGIESCLPKHLT